MKLTDHLISLRTTPSYEEATRHPFLLEAGEGSLPSARLALWLSQDRIYAAHAYPRFIGSLISLIPFHQRDSITGPEEAANQKILKILVGCLDNIVREVGFFKDTAERWDLDMEGWKERKGTRDYTAEMARVSNASLKEGLIFLWAMERVYLDAWKFVNNLQKATQSGTSESPVLAFSQNWSSTEFEVFVAELADLVDELGIVPNTKDWYAAEAVWSRVVELEVGFWPEKGEESDMRLDNKKL
ncbi:hypothetical protein CVT24_011283 [Panaeolus cyanescens]|uniref:Thiaminase-2/PQQC domain-containing protein n=1 Tax=Panaeolus cyanescens TaxID=181874 RepID=A0A409YUX9_9AGAR|nr:hypothetical protein CVT24_011283 [Panaeolus cyanescens]